MGDQKADTNGLLEIGKLLGRREAFGLVGGRCSAAEANCMRDIRETKTFKHLAPSWEEFCDKHLRMSRAAADRAIRLLEEFGPGYFELSQLIRIPPDAYRVIASAVKDKAVHVNGEAIPLVPENAEKVAAAVAILRFNRPMKSARSGPRESRIATLARGCREGIAALAELYQSGPGIGECEALAAAVDDLHAAISRLRSRIRQ